MLEITPSTGRYPITSRTLEMFHVIAIILSSLFEATEKFLHYIQTSLFFQILPKKARLKGSIAIDVSGALNTFIVSIILKDSLVIFATAKTPVFVPIRKTFSLEVLAKDTI